MRGVKSGLPFWLKLMKQFIPRQVLVQKAKPRSLVAVVGFSSRLHLVDKMLKTSKGGIRLSLVLGGECNETASGSA